MAKFHGVIGYTARINIRPGVWDDSIIEREYVGDFLKIRSSWQSNGEKLLDDVSFNNRISIVADAYANENFFAMRYVKWSGMIRSIESVEVDRPRLILTIGGVYNGPEA